MRFIAITVAGLLFVAGCAASPAASPSPAAIATAPPASGSPTPAPATEAPASGLTPTRPAPTTSPAVKPGIPADLLAIPGAITIATATQTAGGGWQLVLTVVRPGEQPVAGAFALPVPDGWLPRQRSRVRISPDGWAALELTSVEDRDIDDDAIMTVDLVGDGGSSEAILGSAPTWLPDGMLLFTTSLRHPHREVARRIRDHGLGRTLDLVIDEDEARPLFPGSYLVHGNVTGLQGWRGDWDDPALLLIRWNGTVLRREWADPPLLVLGAERSASASGDRLTGCAPWACPVEWRVPAGRQLELPVPAFTHAWTRDGTALVALDIETPRVNLVRRVGDSLIVDPLVTLPTGAVAGDILDFAGMSSWAAVLETDEASGRVTIIPFDGSAVIGPFDGTLAAVTE